jgi:hypothetical protein
VSLDARVGVAKHLAVPVGDKDDDVRVIQLRPEKRAVCVLGPRRSRNETLRVEVVVQSDEESAEPANRLEVRRGCWADVSVAAQRATVGSIRINASPLFAFIGITS